MCLSGVEADVLHRRPPDVSASIAGSKGKMSQIFNCSLLVPLIPPTIQNILQNFFKKLLQQSQLPLKCHCHKSC